MMNHRPTHRHPPASQIKNPTDFPFAAPNATPPPPPTQVVARDCVQDAGEKFKESTLFYATARQRNAEKEMSEATLRKMHRKARTPPPPSPRLTPSPPPPPSPRLKSLRVKSKPSLPRHSRSCGMPFTTTLK